MTGTLYWQRAPSFGWDVKPRSWLSVVIKNPMALLVKSRGVTPVSWPNSLHWPCQSWPPNNPHPLDWLYDSPSSPPVAGVWWAHWRLCPVAAVASSRWMLHTGGGWGETPPHMIVKRFGCTAIHKKALYKCIIHSFITWWTGVVWITCGLLWCFYKLFGLSFWRHPFTAEDPLVNKWWNATFLHRFHKNIKQF